MTLKGDDELKKERNFQLFSIQIYIEFAVDDDDGHIACFILVGYKRQR